MRDVFKQVFLFGKINKGIGVGSTNFVKFRISSRDFLYDSTVIYYVRIRVGSIYLYIRDYGGAQYFEVDLWYVEICLL